MILRFLLRWILNAVALYLTVIAGELLHLRIWVDSGIDGVRGLLIAVALLAIVNASIRPFLRLLSLPLTCLTLGLFGLVINAALFWLVGQFVPGFHVSGFVAALFGSCAMSVVSGALSHLVKDRNER